MLALASLARTPDNTPLSSFSRARSGSGAGATTARPRGSEPVRLEVLKITKNERNEIMQIVVTIYRRDAEGCESAGDAKLTGSQLRNLEDALANCANDWIEENALDRSGGVAARCMPEDTPRDEVHLVTVDNGDTEPEIWAFAADQDAVAFAEARTGFVRYPALTIPVLDKASAAKLIAAERSR